MSLAIAIAGWLGAAILLWAYALASLRKLDSGGAQFQLMNIAGAVGLATHAATSGAWASAAVNVIWIGIGLGTLWRRASRPALAGTAPRPRQQ